MAKRSGTRAKGEGSIFQEASGRWVAAFDAGYRDGKRLRRKVTGWTRREVVDKAAKLRRDLEAGVFSTNATVEEWMKHWIDVVCPERGLRPRTIYGYQRYIDRYITPVIGKVELRKLTADHVRAVHRRIKDKGLSATTVRQAHAIMARAFKVAEREGRIRRNPAALVDAPSPRDNPHPVLSVEQAAAVFRAAAASQDARLMARLVCALVLGLRQSEALALRWADIDLVKDTLSVTESVQRVPGRGPTRQGVKTAASERVIPLPPAAALVLAAWAKAADPAQEYVFPGRTQPIEDARHDWAVWKAALEQAGVPHVPLHGARGSAASILRAMGVPERWIADVLGHATVHVTQEHYLHSDDAQRLDALTRLAGQLGLASGEARPPGGPAASEPLALTGS